MPETNEIGLNMEAERMEIIGDIFEMGTAPELRWWITVIELPAMAGLFWMVMRNATALNNYKLHVAEKYASVDYLKDVEGRLIDEIKDVKKLIREQQRGE